MATVAEVKQVVVVEIVIMVQRVDEVQHSVRSLNLLEQ